MAISNKKFMATLITMVIGFISVWSVISDASLITVVLGLDIAFALGLYGIKKYGPSSVITPSANNGLSGLPKNNPGPDSGSAP